MGFYLLILLLLPAGCSETPTDPVTQELFTQDTTLDTLEKIFRSESYWTKKVAALTTSTTQARTDFQNRNQEYRNKLLQRRESVIRAVQEARKWGKDPQDARQEATQAHRNALAQSRDAARDAGRQLRIQLALLRRAQEFLDQAR